MNQFLTKLDKIGVCSESWLYCEDYEDFETAWNECQMGSWMLWLAARIEAVKTNVIQSVLEEAVKLVPDGCLTAMDKISHYSGYSVIVAWAINNPEIEKESADICRKILSKAVIERWNQLHVYY